MAAHENLSHESAPQGGSDRSFGVVFTVVFLVISLLPLNSGEPVRYWMLGIACLFLLISLIRPALLAVFNRVWTKFGLILGQIVNPVVMAILYYGIITPFGLVMRAAGKDPLSMQLDKSAKTYWVYRDPPGPAADSLKNQF
jgi:hypothetical protein